MTRTFESGPARRERTPIAIGIVGPSGSGKTKSALRLADGMARVGGGATWLVDTNNRRSLHHAPDHAFIALHMPPPYSPVDYGAAFEHAITGGARRIIVDSISDEWEGEGGVLDMHEDELDRMAGNDYQKRERCNQAGWIRPKREHNRLRLWMFQQPIDWILTFRAKEKTKPASKADKAQGEKDAIIDLGWQPLGAEDLVYELLLKCLLRPQCDGKPVWTSEVLHERALMKLPGWFRDLFATSPQLDEGIGEQLARWAAGGDVAAPARAATSSTATSRPTTSVPPASQPPARPHAAVLVERYDACTSRETLEQIKADARAVWESIPRGAARTDVSEAFKSAEARVAAAAQSSPAATIGDDEAREIAALEAARARELEQTEGDDNGT